jgi:pimeloyl-ACP methyl ester carboxylesterase
MIHKLITTPSGKIEYCSLGTGQPVLFMHGGHSNCHDTLAHKGLDLRKFRLITPSRPGYGQTPLSNHKTPLEAAGLMKSLLDELHLDQVIVYGISAGGLTAMELAARFPERVNKLILASAVTQKWLDKEDRTYTAARRMFHPTWQKIIWSLVRFFVSVAPNQIAHGFIRQFSSKPDPVITRHEVRELITALKNYDSGEGFVNDLDQTIDVNTLEEIRCPTLIVHSEYDQSVPLSHALHAHKRIKLSTMIALKNDWGHLLWIGRDAPVVVQEIATFIGIEAISP